MLKIVELDQVCRQQQVNDGCFSSLESVPTHALTLTLSFIRSVPEAICVVPTDRKAKAIASALHGPVTTDCPASMLRKLSGAALYLDRESAELAFPDISGE
jgi:glucosamine-6-phosphate deaminase